jgi:Icc-related predicted phosphoesterase
MKLVCISDSHMRLKDVVIPDGDVLVHSGDLTFRGTIQETSKELTELSKHRPRFKEILLVEGNHDWLGMNHPQLMDQMCKDHGITLLRDSGITIDGINFWGSPFTPELGSWAFMLDRMEGLKEKWDLIPSDTHVLITHGAPMGILDTVEKFNAQKREFESEHVGCIDLMNRILDLNQLKLHIFGHIHSGYGTHNSNGRQFVNAAICTERYDPTNKPLVIEI